MTTTTAAVRRGLHPLWDLDNHELEVLTNWARSNHTDLPVYGRLYIWAINNGYSIDNWATDDLAAFRWVRNTITDRMITTGLDQLEITRQDLKTAGLRVTPT